MNKEVLEALDALDHGIIHRTQTHADMIHVSFLRKYIKEIEEDWDDDVKTMRSLAKSIEEQHQTLNYWKNKAHERLPSYQQPGRTKEGQ